MLIQNIQDLHKAVFLQYCYMSSWAEETIKTYEISQNFKTYSESQFIIVLYVYMFTLKCTLFPWQQYNYLGDLEII